MEDYKEETINSYNQNAKEFSEKFAKLTDILKRREFSRFLGLLSGKKILDLGCGAGEHALYFKSQGLDVFCADISEEMIKLCKEKGLDAEISDIENLIFPEGSFDGVWAVTSLLHVPKSNLREVINNLNKILKERGILFVSLKEGGGERMIEDKGKKTKRFFAFWQKEEILKLFEEKFNFIESNRSELGDSVFINSFFSKKS